MMLNDMTSEMFYICLNATGSVPDALEFGFDTLPRQGHHGGLTSALCSTAITQENEMPA
jgi:hypothetical protein